MKKRSIIAVIVFGFITLGIYSWYWAVKTKGEMNKLGEKIPTAWIWLIPIVGPIYWYWKYSEGVEHLSQEKFSWILAFVVLYLLGSIGQGIIQDTFNKLGSAQPISDPSVQASIPVQPATEQPTTPTEPTISPTKPSPPTTPPTNPPLVGG